MRGCETEYGDAFDVGVRLAARRRIARSWPLDRVRCSPGRWSLALRGTSWLNWWHRGRDVRCW